MTIAKPQQELLNPLKNPLKTPLKNSLKPLPKLLNRVILLGAGAGLLAWGLTLTTNRITSVTATKAFVNGKIITITSPLNGQVQSKENLDSGMAVKTQQLLLKVNEPLSNSQWLENLRLDLFADQAKLESIETKIHEFSKPGSNQKNPKLAMYRAQEVALAQLDSATSPTQSYAAVRLAEQNVKQAEIELKVAQGHEQVAKSKYEKFRFLARQGAMSNFAVEEVSNNWKVAQEQIEAAKVKIETAQLNLAEQQRIKSGYRQSSQKAVSIDTQIGELNPELAELKRQKTELQVSIQAKEKAIMQAEKSAVAQKNFPVFASSKGVLWEVMVQNGEQVRAGQPLLKQLNCQQLWVDAFVNIDDLKRMQIGSPAQVELSPNKVKLNGWVKTIRSPLSNEQKLGQDVAVNPPDMKNQQLAQVRIELENHKELINNKQSSARFCQVGQVAKVNIGQENSLFANLPF